MGRKSSAKRKRHALGSAGQSSLNPMPKSSDPSEQVAYCSSCGSITMGIQASGLYEGLIFDLPHICPNCNQWTEIITWDEWQSREAQVPPDNPTPRSA